MAYWGLAFAQLPNPLVPPFDPAALKRASDALAKGQALPATQREKDWLAATVPFFRDAATVDQSERTRRYAAAMESLASRYPDDAEAQIFFALALLQAADPHDRTFAEPVPGGEDPGAAPGQPPQAPGHRPLRDPRLRLQPHREPGARRGRRLRGHRASRSARHSHALPRLLDAGDVGPLHRVEPGHPAGRAGLCDEELPAGGDERRRPHSLDFMEYAYLQQGRDREALAVVKDTAAIQKLNVTFLAQATGLAAVPVRYALERGAWAEAAALEIRPTDHPYAEAVGRFGRAIGAARLGTPEHQVEARREIERMKELRASYLVRPDQAYWAEQTEILVQAASGWLARAQGNDAEALRLLRSGADLEDASEKHVAMENRVFPVREQLAYLLLELGQAEAALVEFQASMKSTPNRLRGYYGAARAAELAGLPGIAAPYRERLRELTKEASGSRVEIAYARGDPAALR